MQHGYITGCAPVEKPKTMVAAVDASYKDGIYGCGYLFSNGHWGLEFSDFKDYELLSNVTFAELWGLYNLVYQISDLRIKSVVKVYIDNDYAAEIANASFVQNKLQNRWHMSAAGHTFLEHMTSYIGTFHGKLKVIRAKPLIHRGAHRLSRVAQGLGRGTYTRAAAIQRANEIVYEVL